MELWVAVLSGFALAIVAPFVYRMMRGACGWVLALFPLGVTLYLASFLPEIAAGKVIRVSYAWAPTLEMNLSLQLDGLGLLFALLISGIGALILIYAGAYLHGHIYLGRLYAFLLLFMASMLGVVLTDNILVMFVFWELTSVSSYLLIGFDHNRAAARAAALQAFLVTGGGGLALLAGLLLLGQVGGSYEFSRLVEQSSHIQSHAYYAPILLLILAGAFTKSAQFPFHFWLPNAMEAPTPISAYLHSATMVKAGIYLLARLNPTLGGTELWIFIVTIAGGVTMLLGAWLALQQSDLKRILAYSTVSTLGMLTFLLGLGGELAILAAMGLVLAHALYKGTLFLVAGTLDHQTGTRNIDELGGLFRKMPVTALAAITAALSMAGVPPLVGFISKELLYETTLQHRHSIGLIAAAMSSSVFLTAAAMVIGIRPFFGKVRETPKQPREGYAGLLLGSIVLAGLSIVFGLWPDSLPSSIVSAASTAALGREVVVHLALWHGLNTALILSAATLIAGGALYGLRHRLRLLAVYGAPLANFGPSRWYEWALMGLNAVALAQTRILQSGYLRYYLLIILMTIIGLTGYTLISRGNLVLPSYSSDVRFFELGLAVLIVLAVIATISARVRLAAIAALSVVGYCIALMFVWFGAPDVAMTQFLIETLTVILLVLVFYHLPEARQISSHWSRLRDGAVAITVGVLMTALVLVSANAQEYAPISPYFSENSLPRGHGRNIVNVILVDFRAFDTMGEITVLTVAGIGVFALLNKLRLSNTLTKSSAGGRPPLVRTTDEMAATPDSERAVFINNSRESGSGLAPSLILRTTTGFIFSLLMLFSIFLLLRGHNEPGGGFSGGLVAASVFILHSFAFGVTSTMRILPVTPRGLTASGLLIAIGSGCLALLSDNPLMTADWITADIPGFGELHLGTPLLFDLGVYLTVLGMALFIILPLCEER